LYAELTFNQAYLLHSAYLLALVPFDSLPLLCISYFDFVLWQINSLSLVAYSGHLSRGLNQPSPPNAAPRPKRHQRKTRRRSVERTPLPPHSEISSVVTGRRWCMAIHFLADDAVQCNCDLETKLEARTSLAL